MEGAKQAEAASALYAAVQSACARGRRPKAKDAMATLADSYAGTGYAPRAVALRAKLWPDGDKAGARAQFQWVVDRVDDEDLKRRSRATGWLRSWSTRAVRRGAQAPRRR